MQSRPNEPLVIYHAGCKDGFCAAWVAYEALSSLDRTPELLPRSYGQDPPLEGIAGREIYILDFSWPRRMMERIIEAARTLVVLDHHKTAEADLKPLQGELDFSTSHHILFDMNRSGAGMTWDWFRPVTPRPWLVNYVEDRDIWKWALPDSRIVNAYIASLDYTLQDWEAASHLTVEQAFRFGEVLIKKANSYNAALIEHLGMLKNPGSFTNIPIINAPTEGISELMESMLSKNPTAPYCLAWRVRKDGSVSVSLRSTEGRAEAIDVSELAKMYGGGGHKHAAGFELHNHEAEVFVTEMVSGK